MPMTAREIVHEYTKNRMSARPEYYSGRGATLSDLDSKLLEMIYQGILKEIGQNAAKELIKMVEDLDVLSATHFLNSLYALEARSWRWERRQRKAGPMDHIDVGSDQDPEARLTIGLCSIGAWGLGGSDRDETDTIRGAFLQKYGSRKTKLSHPNDRAGRSL